MNQKEIKELIEFLIEKDITEFELERGDVKVRVKRGAESCLAPHGRRAISRCTRRRRLPPELGYGARCARRRGLPRRPKPEPAEESAYGAFSDRGDILRVSFPGSPPFVKAGRHDRRGQVLCIVEAMKLMNEIESDVAGEMVKRLVSQWPADRVWAGIVRDSGAEVRIVDCGARRSRLFCVCEFKQNAGCNLPGRARPRLVLNKHVQEDPDCQSRGDRPAGHLRLQGTGHPHGRDL